MKVIFFEYTQYGILQTGEEDGRMTLSGESLELLQNSTKQDEKM